MSRGIAVSEVTVHTGRCWNGVNGNPLGSVMIYSDRVLKIFHINSIIVYVELGICRKITDSSVQSVSVIFLQFLNV